MRIDARARLSLVLWAVALHSAAVGAGLIVLPSSAVQRLGFSEGPDRFFRTQGGVFHLVVALAYALAAWDPWKRPVLVAWAVTVKFAATVFLLTYYFAVEPKLLVLLSGLGDAAMGGLLLAAWRGGHGR